MSTTTTTTTTSDAYTPEQFASLAYADQLGLSRRGKVMASAILADTDPAHAAQALFLAFRGPYLKAKSAGRTAELRLWAKAWNGSSAALVAPLKDGGFKAQWPDLRNGLTRAGSDCVTLLTVSDAADLAARERTEKAERDAKDLAQFQADDAAKRREAALALPLDDLVTQLVAAIGATSHELGTVVAELSKLAKSAAVRPAKSAADRKVA